MKSISTVWLRVCLYSALALAAAATLPAASPANGGNGPAGDVPSINRSTEEVKLNTGSVSRSDIEILESARAANEDVYASLESFACDEKINRFQGSLNGQALPLDTVAAKLSFEGGIEHYSNVTQNDRPKAGMSSLPGAWSQGEFGTLLLQTQQLLTTQKVNFDSYTSLKGEQAAVYHFDVAAGDSAWRFIFAGHHYRLPFRTNVWISVSTGEILRIERATMGLAAETHISEIQWGITLDRVALNGTTWLLPATGSYAVLYNESKHKEWNQISFTGYQRNRVEAALKFE